jgi:N utilization substance protein B
MANRHLARAIAMQSLFEWDFRGNPTAALPAIIQHNIKEFGAGLGHTEFTEEIVDGVIKHLSEIDELRFLMSRANFATYCALLISELD